MIKTVFYRTADGRADYHFSFEQQSDGTWRVYILSAVDYRGRLSDCYSTHRLNDGNRQYICWTTPISKETDARAIAAAWADKTQRYIRFGEAF
jgi:hypothetical protein